MTPNLAGRDSYLARFDQFKRLCGTAPGTTGRGHVLADELA
jgi:hypothetical protein